MKLVFVDSSVLFSAVNSPIGGSSKLFTLIKIKLITSKVVLIETERNVRKKLHNYHLERFLMLAEQIGITQQVPSHLIIKKAKKAIVEKDSVILAESYQSKADFLVTLDQKHFLSDSVAKFLKPQKALTPKMLIEAIEEKKI